VEATWIAIALVAGCYQPSAEPPCSVTCSAANACPGELTCDVTDHVCKHNGSCETSPADAVDSPNGTFCYGHPDGLGEICLASRPTGSLLVTATTTINTDTDPACRPVSLVDGEVCVIAVDAIDIRSGGTLRTYGSRPLVLIGVTAIQVNGILDASSHGTLSSLRGAGGDYLGCNAGIAPTTLGGGAGGSYRVSGAAGAFGNGQVTGGGMAGAIDQVLAVRGGCIGQTGESSSSGPGGAGGGAVYLISDHAVTLGPNGGINASGAGGPGGASKPSGGNGGGSGGLIGIDALNIVDAGGFLLADGGGGGCGGGGPSAGGAGTDPSHGVLPSGCTTNIFSGGYGGYLAQLPMEGSAGDPGSGGGGGGGGFGVIFLRPITAIADRSPTGQPAFD
jgi:hypothetical protein